MTCGGTEAHQAAHEPTGSGKSALSVFGSQAPAVPDAAAGGVISNYSGTYQSELRARN